ncbi:conserved hypothetical protein [Gammaproteobacteria bacterium]
MFEPDDAECPNCGEVFWKDEPWKRVCLDCWLKKKRTAGKAESAFSAFRDNEDLFAPKNRNTPEPEKTGTIDELNAEVRRLANDNSRLTRENMSLEGKMSKLMIEFGKLTRMVSQLQQDNTNLHRQVQTRAHQSASFPGDMMRRLLQLCHPDKHNGSEAALKATKWLLDQR